VIARIQGLSPSEVGGSRLQSLFAGIANAVEEGRLKEALRLADCACRNAPANPTCHLIHARLLMRLGSASEAIARLRGREEPDAIVARAEALCVQGALDDAAASTEGLLRRFAVDSIENLRPLASRLCRPPGPFPGWVGVDTSLRLIGEVQNGIPVAIAYAGRIRHPAISAVNSNGLTSFEFEIPAGVSGQITAFSGHLPLLGSGFNWPPEFGLSGWVMLENKAVVGKAKLEWAPTRPITLAITPAGGEPIRLSVASAGASRSAAFSVSLDGLVQDASPIEVAAVLPDGRHSPFSGSPVKMWPISPTPIGIRPARTVRTGPGPELTAKHIVDIVVPVYTGFKETLSCLERVLATTSRDTAELVVVNDASPDLELCEALARLARNGRITLLTNPSNLGFPGSANRGMNLHAGRDVVLLNSDAEVFGDWLDRLQFAAYCADDIGTVTPLGETASIMSYPGGGERALTRLDSVAIDRIARDVNARKLIELPVGVGFCLYMKRACLDEIGGFDENSFGKGYGEENDFCLRARRNGWRHVGATDLFVGHPGGRSYGRSKEMLMERNRRVLDALHPGYEALIAGFVAADPLLQARRAIDTYRLLQQARDPVLLVTCDLPGGVKRHVDLRQSELSAAGHTVLILQPAGTAGRADRVTLRTQDSSFENLAYNLPEETHILRDLLSKLGLSHIELHHFVGLPGAAIELAASLDVRYNVYVHDYSWICPRVTLLGGNEVYCGEPPVEDCEICIRTYGTELEESLSVAALRSRSARILKGANHVIVPTYDVRSRLAQYFPGLPIEVAGWEAVERGSHARTSQSGRVRVAVIGAISIQKGHQILLQCAKDAAERNLDLDFVVIGFTIDDAPLLATGRVFVSGPYAESEIHALLEREQCQVAFFPSVAPETWCYALTHAMSWGLPIAAFDLGAIAERLRTYDAAELLPLSTRASDLNDSLMRLAQRFSTSDPQKELFMSDTSPASDSPVSQELEATAKVLTLPVGVYAFTVQGGAPMISSQELALPAMQLGLAPMQSPGLVEFLAGAGTLDRWLTRDTDTFIVRISGDSVALLLTSVRLPSSPALTINVQRIDTEPQPIASDAEAINGKHGVLPTQILAHIENFGDIYFNDGRAGFAGQRLRMEAFAILSVGQLEPGLIEYCGVMADGYQTPWLSNQILCGSRGRGMPLTGYAIRLKREISDRYDCTYTGKFLSGYTFGPFKNGDLCSSSVPGDPLEAIELRIAERSPSEPMAPGQEIEHSDRS
jgi:GT2 family glycosyltransferase/glycosyltransferase involved in cell wall biosynthesis